MGKSSLINALCRVKGLARVSRTPGRTRLLNFFHVELQAPDGERVPLRLVDLPGYGHADVSRRTKFAFGVLVESYLVERAPLRGLIVLVDSRRGADDRDRQLLDFARNRSLPSLLVATKADKLGASERGLLARRLASETRIPPAQVLMTSATKGFGVEGHARQPGLADEVARLVRGEPT